MRLLPFALMALMGAGAALAADPQVSDASVKELMAIGKSRELVDRSIGQIDEAIQAEMQRSLDGKELTPEQQKIMDDLRTKLVAVFTQAMSWDVLEPKFIEVYKQSFTQSEIDGILAFYRTEAGQAVLAKMPVVMDKVTALIQERMQAVAPKVNALQQEAVERMDAAQK